MTDYELFGNRYRVSSASIVGRRKDNQDSTGLAVVKDDLGEDMLMALVCDGMGGLKNGGEASRLVADRIVEWAKTVRRDDLDGVCRDFMANRIQTIEKELRTKHEGSGTTLSMVIGMGGRWASLHLGDSRCYCLGNDGYEFRTKDHTPIEAMLDAGIIDESEIENHPMRNVVSKYVGGGFASDIEVQELKRWDELVLCTDGAYGCMPKKEFSRLIRENDAETIVHRCYEHGSQDNITAIKLKKLS